MINHDLIASSQQTTSVRLVVVLLVGTAASHHGSWWAQHPSRGQSVRIRGVNDMASPSYMCHGGVWWTVVRIRFG